MNSVNLSGRLTREPEIRTTNDGKSIATFTVACDRRFKSDNGPSADFIRCIAFGKPAEVIEKYMHKGSGIEILGQIQTGSYKNKDGNTVYTTDVIVEAFEFPKASKNDQQNSNSIPEGEFVNIPDGIDEELPFG